jgi:hypothetical protein
VPVSVDELVLLGGTGFKNQPGQNYGAEKYVSKLQNYR